MLKPNFLNPHHQAILNLIFSKRPDLQEAYHMDFDEFSAIVYGIPQVRKLASNDYGLLDNFMTGMHRFFGTKPSLHPVRRKRNYDFVMGVLKCQKITPQQKDEILSYITSMLKHESVWTEQDPYYPGYRYLNRKVWEKFLKPIANSTFIAQESKILLSAMATILYELQYVDRSSEIRMNMPVIFVSETDPGLTAELLQIAETALLSCPHSV